ncbi:anti-anti-sigma regulatory factor [Streptacidiphilus sp. MAP12-16]|uniref:STAS domain-containing protein n=1 Tax=Streptacidiphilus sp. MAP12-16 TaxID=3156300 RepID=UPI0035178408
MTLRIRSLQGCTVVTLPTEVDLANIDHLRFGVRNQLWNRLPELPAVVFDLTHASFIGWEASALIIETWHRGRHAGVPIRVAAPTRLHRRILQLSGLDPAALFRDMPQAVSGMPLLDQVS